MTLTHKRLVDKMTGAYIDWREACCLVTDAYRSWVSRTGPSAANAFACYSEALDREERAAEVYAGLVRRVARRLVTVSAPFGDHAARPWKAR
jgi:hypothetical protein